MVDFRTSPCSGPAPPKNVLGPVPGVDVMAKRPRGWVKCEDRLPYYRKSEIAPAACHLPRLHDHDSTTRESRVARTSAGAGAPGVQSPLAFLCLRRSADFFLALWAAAVPSPKLMRLDSKPSGAAKQTPSPAGALIKSLDLVSLGYHPPTAMTSEKKPHSHDQTECLALNP
jgi:hypothetical protein